jgi:hypothetical protein
VDGCWRWLLARHIVRVDWQRNLYGWLLFADFHFLAFLDGGTDLTD